jgi:hypothetical protein
MEMGTCVGCGAEETEINGDGYCPDCAELEEEDGGDETGDEEEM